MEKEARSAGQNPSGPKKRSLHHIDDDDDDEPVKNAEPDNKDDKDKAEGNEDSDAEISADTADMPKLKDDKGTTRYEKKKK